mmetsp:Transcript_27680/g.69711  ORF Transcript_27680/g.69711 Transcript_27680/m.69711 type:complete len:232 (-) Transcript_27680:5-700(-)
MENLTVVVHERAVAMLQAIPPTPIEGMPLARVPRHLAAAFPAVGHELPDVLDAVLPLHAALSGHRVLGEVALVDRSVCPLQHALPVGLAAVELSRVLRALGPGHLAVTTPHVIDVVPIEPGTVEVHLRALALPLVVAPVGLVLGALRIGQRAAPVSLTVPELAPIRGIVRVGDDNVSIPWTLLHRRERHDGLGHRIRGDPHPAAPAAACAQLCETACWEGAFGAEHRSLAG